MTQEEKQLLLKDLSARLPYGVIAKIECFNYHDLLHPKVLLPEDIKLSINNIHRLDFGWKSCKPYLRPMSSMTEEEINEFILISDTVLWLGNKRSTCILSIEQTDWLNKNMFDYRGLIPMGLALEAKEGMYKI